MFDNLPAACDSHGEEDIAEDACKEDDSEEEDEEEEQLEPSMEEYRCVSMIDGRQTGDIHPNDSRFNSLISKFEELGFKDDEIRY